MYIFSFKYHANILYTTPDKLPKLVRRSSENVYELIERIKEENTDVFLKNRYIDLHELEKVGSYINWRKLTNLEK